MELDIHRDIKEKLNQFYKLHKIPNIVFNGVSGSGKSKIVKDFIDLIYEGTNKNYDNYVMWVNCAHGKGIKFVREELKFFAKTNINTHNGNIFKSIILLNGDKLTTDAQSALRRCIEQFNHTTRFFITVEDKYQLLKPILSRFCEIYVPEPEIDGKIVNLYQYNIKQIFHLDNEYQKRITSLKSNIAKILSTEMTKDALIQFITKIYNSAYSSLDLIYLIETNYFKDYLPNIKKYEVLLLIGNIKKEFRSEKMLMLYILHLLYFDKDMNIDNSYFI